MKRTRIILLLLILRFSSFAQVDIISLARPRKAFFNSRDTTEEIMFSYLKTYYNEIGEKKFGNDPRLESIDMSGNTWRQEFSKGIIYEYDTGGAPNSITGKREYLATILFPNAKKKDIVMLVEEFYKRDNCSWYDSKKEAYGLKSLSVGFTCEIRIEKNSIILRVCSHC